MKNGVGTLGLIALTGGLLLLACSKSDEPRLSKATGTPPAAHGSPAAPRPMPPYYESAEAAKPFPAVLPAAYFRDYPVVARAYRIAGQMPGVIAQQPCYCYCNKGGHRSLLDCFASDHGARCLICIKEVLLAEEMTRQGKTPGEIREAIIRGEHAKVSLR